jgi:hypothetical protein
VETRPTAEWLAAYRRLIANLRAALDWAFSPEGDASIGVALTAAALPLWKHLSLMEECRGRVERAITALGSGASRDTRREMQFYSALATSLFQTKGPVLETCEAWTKVLHIAGNLGATEYQLRALCGLWVYRMNSGEYKSALTLAEDFGRLAGRKSDRDDLLVLPTV